VVAVDPLALMTAAQSLYLTGTSAQQKLASVHAALSDQHGMAGTDLAAGTFSGQYDPAAKSVYDSVATWAAACRNLAVMLGATALNHNDANAAAAQKPPPDIGSVPTDSGPRPGSSAGLPSSLGDPSSAPAWWTLIERYVQGKLWPNGHQDRLRASRTAWHDLASDVDSNAWQLYDQMKVLNAQDSPDLDAATDLFNQLYGSMAEISSAARALGDTCETHAANIDAAHREIVHQAAELVLETAIIGGITMLVSGGLAAAGGGAAAEANLTRVGAAIANTIRGFEGTTLAVAGGAAAPAAVGARIAATMEGLAGLPVARISAMAAGGNAARLTAEDLQSLRKADYESYRAGKAAKGLPARDEQSWWDKREALRNAARQGDDFEKYVRENNGLTEANGWESQKYAPNGKGVTETGARRWDFANKDLKEAVECKSGQVDKVTFDKQFAIDRQMVTESGWSMRYFLKEPLNPNQMAQLRQLEVDSGGKFTIVIGGG
jgi:hypothetical protein